MTAFPITLADVPRRQPDSVVLQDGHEIKISGTARWYVEIDLFCARLGTLGSLECLRLQGNYYQMGRRLLLNAEKAAAPARKAWLTYWGNRHMEIADGFADHLMDQHDRAKFADSEPDDD